MRWKRERPKWAVCGGAVESESCDGFLHGMTHSATHTAAPHGMLDRRRCVKRALRWLSTSVQDGTKAQLSEQLRKGAELSRKMSTLEDLSSDDEMGALSDSTEASDSEGEGEGEDGEAGEQGEGRKLKKGEKGMASARRRAEAVLAGIDEEEGQEPQGLFALPFMARALSKQRKESALEATQLIEELDRVERQEAQGSEEEEVRVTSTAYACRLRTYEAGEHLAQRTRAKGGASVGVRGG